MSPPDPRAPATPAALLAGLAGPRHTARHALRHVDKAGRLGALARAAAVPMNALRRHVRDGAPIELADLRRLAAWSEGRIDEAASRAAGHVARATTPGEILAGLPTPCTARAALRHALDTYSVNALARLTGVPPATLRHHAVERQPISLRTAQALEAWSERRISVAKTIEAGELR